MKAGFVEGQNHAGVPAITERECAKLDHVSFRNRPWAAPTNAPAARSGRLEYDGVNDPAHDHDGVAGSRVQLH